MIHARTGVPALTFLSAIIALAFVPQLTEASDGLAAITTAAASCPDDSGNRFVDCGNGTVTDNTTGLVWMQDSGCTGIAPEATWQSAMLTASGTADGLCGLTDGSQPGDWRLASKSEWEAMLLGVPAECDPRIHDDAGVNCWIEGVDVFTNVQSERYWSASTQEGNVNRAFFVNLMTGVVETGNKEGLLLVWPVRTAQ